MTLRARLWLSAALAAACALLIGLTLLFAIRQMDEARQHAETADAIARGIFELNILTQEYALRGSSRVVAQWLARHQSLGQLLDSVRWEQGEKASLTRRLRADHGDMSSQFAQLAQAGNDAWGRRLLSQTLIKAQAMDSLARQLAVLFHREVISIQRRVDGLVIGAVVTLTLVVALIQLLLSRTIMRSVRKLTEGIGRFAAGDLAHRIPQAGIAEFDVITRSFNDMAGQLGARTAQLETANKDLEGFSYSVSHDLRTPLRAIDGFSRILIEDHRARLDDEGRRLLNVVRENTAKMGHLIDDILMFSRAGRLELAPVRIDMEALTRSAWEELAPTRGSRDVRIDIRRVPEACGDRAALAQVMTNLLSNAVKFTRPRETALIEVDGRINGGETVYSVKDNGVGFDMRYAHKLFGVFQRLHAQDEFEGTGIGLAIVKRFVTKHGGRVWAESGVNEGAQFHFTLPRREPCEGGDS